MWPFYPFLSGNSGVTPPYAQTPQGSSWPFYTKGGAGSRALTPYQAKPLTAPSSPQLPVTQQPAQLPATQDGFKLPVRSVTGDLQKVLAFLPPSLRGSLLGPAGTAAATAASVMAPKPLNEGEVPQYIRDAQGNVIPNPARTATVDHGFVGPEYLGPTPTDAFGSDPNASGVPLPRPRPVGPPMSLAPPGAAAQASAPAQDPFSFMGPGFGAGDNGNMSPANMGQGSTLPQTQLLQMLLAKLQGK